MPLGLFNSFKDSSNKSTGEAPLNAPSQGMNLLGQTPSTPYMPRGLQRFRDMMRANPSTMPRGVERFMNKSGFFPPQIESGQFTSAGALNPPGSGLNSSEITGSAQTKSKMGIMDLLNRFKFGGVR